MITEEIRNSLKQANQVLLQAEEELNRPHEDVVTLSACQSVRTSMKLMMRHYLTALGAKHTEGMSMEELLNACIKTNDIFSRIDVSNIECKGIGHDKCEGKYCLSIENVSCCITAANQLKAIVWSELKVN